MGKLSWVFFDTAIFVFHPISLHKTIPKAFLPKQEIVPFNPFLPIS
jgi:hypothetical protein